VKDVLLNITGASVARVCRVLSDVLPNRVNQHLLITRPKATLESAFLERLLLSHSMQSYLLQIGGAGTIPENPTPSRTGCTRRVVRLASAARFFRHALK
jgi:hypothetical protein